MKKLLVIVTVLLAIDFSLFATGGVEPSEEVEAVPVVWVWGVPGWAGEYMPEDIPKANAWADENYGVNFRISSAPEGVTAEQGLQLLIAQDEFPDVIGNIPTDTLADLAKWGKIAPLDKYLNDPENYPVFAEADQSFLLKYKVDGVQYGFPGGFWWFLNATGPTYFSQMWCISYDVYEKYGGYPKTADELLTLLRKVKADAIPDFEGNPRIPLGITPGDYLSDFIYLIKGGGYEVDAQKRLVPKWAAQEAYEGFKFYNTLWREGLVSPGLFIMDRAQFQESLKFNTYAVGFGQTNIQGESRGLVRSLYNDKGPDDSDYKRARAMQSIMMVDPIQSKPGLKTNNQPSATVISKDCPKPDNVLKFLEWLLTDEGSISTYFDAGVPGVHWEFTDMPLYWQMKPEFRGPTGSQDDQHICNNWIPSADIVIGEKEPLIPPAMFYIISRPYGYYVQRCHYDGMQQFKEQGWFVGSEAGDPTSLEWGSSHCEALSVLGQPIPSYKQMTVAVPALEQSAFATAENRFQEIYIKVVTAASEAEFEDAYKTFIKAMINVADWKPLYEAKQKRWEDFMEANNYDDRAQLRTITVRPEWKAVMGW